jgi:membrane-associated phospholipid phosphatase
MNQKTFRLKKDRTLLSICLSFLTLFLLAAFFRSSFQTVDIAVNLWIPSIQSGTLTMLAKGIAIVFDTTSLVLFSIIIASYLFAKGFKAQAILLLGAMGGDALLVSIIKTLYHIARPTNAVVFDSGFSYPSGHSAGSIVLLGVLAYFAFRHWQGIRFRAVVGVGLGVLVGVVGFDRLYLNVHWFSDVLGGWLFGAFWLCFAVLVFRQLAAAGKFESGRFDLVAMVLFVGAVVVAVLFVLVGLFGSFLPF